MKADFQPVSILDFDLAEPGEVPALCHPRARVLVRLLQEPIGFVDLDLPRLGARADAVRIAAVKQMGDEIERRLDALGFGLVDVHELGDALTAASRPSDSVEGLPFISVVICTRNRAAQLRRCVMSILRLSYPAFEVVVVDNAPSDEASELVCRELAAAQNGAEPRLRYVRELRRGASNARNRGLHEATGEYVAFTDDDVEVDRWWLHAVGRSFRDNTRLGGVTGLVPTAQLEEASQAQFDAKMSWSDQFVRYRYRLGMPEPPFQPFPFAAGKMGVGANFAVRREVLLELGGFDPALGPGAPTRGGEDLDVFLRIVLAGHELLYEPAAIVWHYHRAEPEALRSQMFGYGLGLGAYFAKHLFARSTMWPMVRALGHGMIRHKTKPECKKHYDLAWAMPREVVALEKVGIACGPLVYVRARLEGRKRRRELASGAVRVADPSQ